MPTGWTPAAASSTLEEWSRTFSRWQQCSCFRITVFQWKKTLAYLLVLPGSRARIVRCGGRYDPQLVKRSSECVSDLITDDTYLVIPAANTLTSPAKLAHIEAWARIVTEGRLPSYRNS